MGGKKLCAVRVKFVITVMGTLGTIPTKLRKGLEGIGAETMVTELQENMVLRPARILRKVLEI